MKYINKEQLIAHRKRVLQHAQQKGVSKTARLHGLSRNTIYRWQKELLPKKSGPKGEVPWQTSKGIEKEIIKIRKQTNFGPKRIRVELQLIGIKVGEKAIRGVLDRNGLVKQHRKKRIKKK